MLQGYPHLRKPPNEGLFIDDVPSERNLHLFQGCSMAMLVITRGYIIEHGGFPAARLDYQKVSQ